MSRALARGRAFRPSAITLVIALVAAVLSFVAGAAPAQAAVGVSATRTASGFPRWFQDANNVRLEPCFENDPARCVLLADPGFDPNQPLVFPTNFPGEFFYSVVDSDVVNTPGCQGTRPGKALVRLALEGSFVNGTPLPGNQLVFARTRITVSSGLCPNSSYTFTHPYGQITLQTDVDGSLARNQATTDIGCLAGGCTFTEPLTAPMFRGFLRWDPAVAPAATPGYLSGDAAVLHPIVGASGVGSANAFRINGPGVPVLSTSLFTVAAKIAGPLNATPEAADFGNQPINVPSPSRAVTFTNVSPAPVAISAVSVTPATAPWSIDPAVPTTCTGTLAVDATCTVNLIFAPGALGAATANLQITHSSFRNPTLLPLTGAGTAAVAPNVTSQPGALDFRRVLVGTAGAPLGVVVHNAGPGSYVVDGVNVVDEPAAGGFTGDAARYLPIAGNDCPATGLAPGLSCTVSVRFTPTGQRPTAALLQVAGHVGATSVPLSAHLTGRGGIAASSAAGGVGPAGLGADRFPTWFQDDRGVRLQQCFVNDPARCVLLADPTFNPALPISFPTNYPGEAFYYLADSDVMTTPGCGVASPAGRAQFRAAVEQTFVSGAPVAGEQMAFDRVRVNVTSGLCVGRVYTFVHPYGEFTFTADDLGGLKRAPGTIDTGCTPAPGGGCDFNLSTRSPVSDGFLRWDATAPAPPAGFLGDAGVLHPVAGAPYTRPGSNTPQNRVEIIDTTDGSVVASTSLFTVAGQVDATQTVTRYASMAPSAYPQLSPASALDFGSQNVGTSTPRTVTLESVGTAGLTATAPTITGANAGDFAVTASTCAAQAVGSACTVTVAFTPTGPGARSATLTVPSDAANPWNSTVTLTGTGVGAAVAAISATPTALAFGDQRTASTSPARTVTVTNTGSAPLSVGPLALGGIDAASFAASGCATAVAPGGTCTVSVTFAPATTGAKSATLTLASNAVNAAPVITLTGNGVAPAITVAPATLVFAAQAVGTVSAGQLLTVSNPGTAPLTVSGLSLAGTNPGDFAATGCAAPIGPGASCTISVTFAPAAVGSRSATLTVLSDAVGAQPAPITLSGTGVQPAIAVTPASVTFPGTVVGSPAVVQLVTVTNSGTGSLTVSGLTVTGVNAADFTATGCATPLVGGASCTVTVGFTPSATGVRSASLAIASNAPGAAPTVALSGTGVQAQVSLSPASLAFGGVGVGAAPATQTVTVSNPGTAPLTVSAVSVAGANAADFTAVSACTTPVPAGGTCAVTVSFAPAAIGARSATLTVATNASVPAAAVPLSGTGLGAAVSLSAASLAFGTRLVGTSSGVQSVTVTNTGNAPLVVSAVTVTGTNPGDFSTTSTCTTAAVVPAGTCVVSVTFTPAAAGARSASVTLTTNARPAAVSIAVSGSGTTAATATPASLTFPNTNVNSTAPVQRVTVANSGTAALTFTSVTVGGVNAADFFIGNGCGILAVGATCPIDVFFAPKAPGSRTATVTLTSASGTLTVPLAGTGVGPAATLAPTALAYGSVLVGTTSPTQAVTLTNTGNAPLTVFGPFLSGNWPGEYTQATTCPASLAAGASCTVTVAFRPTGTGARPATINVNTTAGLVTAVLNGTGIQPQLTASTTFVPFPTQAINVPWAPVTVTVSNPGSAPLVVSSATLTGTNPTDFTLVNGCAVAVAPGSTCTLTLGFRPATTGFKTVNLVLASNATPSTTTILVTGSADPAATVPAAPSLCCVTSGNAAVTVFWGAPLTGGSPITQYVVQAYLAGTATAVGAPQTTPGNVFNLNYTGLVNGTAYQFRVAAVNAIGTGPQSAASTAVTPATTPGAMAAPTLTQGNNQFGVSWGAATNTGGSPITGYQVRIVDVNGNQAAFSTTTGATSLTQCCLILGSAYRAQVAAVNALGVGAFGALSAPVTFVANPQSPFIGLPFSGAIGAPLTAGVTWTPQTGAFGTGGLPLTGFVVTAQQFSILGVAVGAPIVSALQPATATRIEMTLPAVSFIGNTYRFTVQAVNGFGTSAPSGQSIGVLPI